MLPTIPEIFIALVRSLTLVSIDQLCSNGSPRVNPLCPALLSRELAFGLKPVFQLTARL
jgi:hypothetical protein